MAILPPVKATPGCLRAAVDVGGTFTDLILVSGEEVRALKVPSTPGRPEQGVLKALESEGALGAPLVHGSTVATNAILERKGARTAFVATAGFKDLIEIGRQNRLSLYRLEVDKPAPLVPPRLRFEAAERVLPGGAVEKRLTRADAESLAAEVEARGARSAAVCLLFSFEHPEHETMIAEALEKRGIKASLSSWILPEYREYERAGTTVVNAYIAPVVEGYLQRLKTAVSGGGPHSLRLMHSAGGTVSPEIAGRRAAGLVLSGPAGGVVATKRLGELLGIKRLISFDMGGTSTDVSLIEGDFAVSRDTTVSGLPVALPMIDIHTIGSGGGSIAGVDRAGVLKVGPESAGADPGPACYGKGTSATVTDANLVLGRLEPGWFFGGRMPLEPARSVKALGGLGRRSARETASAVLQVALSHMERALRAVSLERGHDPRDFTLVAFGGAGPMHACELAERLSIPRVLVPAYPGLFSSIGMLLALPGRDFSRTVLLELDDESVQAIRGVFSILEQEAAREMEAEGFRGRDLLFTRRLSMRYRGQSHEITVPLSRLEVSRVIRDFEKVYMREYGYLRKDVPVEVVNVHLGCRARLPQAEILSRPPEPGGGARVLGKKRMYFSDAVDGRLYDRRSLGAGDTVSGPCLVLQEDTTTVVPPGWRATADSMGNLELRSEP